VALLERETGLEPATLCLGTLLFYLLLSNASRI
jgi:hypothetical protein